MIFVSCSNTAHYAVEKLLGASLLVHKHFRRSNAFVEHHDTYRFRGCLQLYVECHQCISVGEDNIRQPT